MITVALARPLGLYRQHHLSTQALSSFIYYCYFCCIDIWHCACIFKFVCYC